MVGSGSDAAEFWKKADRPRRFRGPSDVRSRSPALPIPPRHNPEAKEALPSFSVSAYSLSMVSRDYTQEVGLSSGEKKVPKAVAIVVIVLLVIGGWFAVRALASSHGHGEDAKPAHTAS